MPMDEHDPRFDPSQVWEEEIPGIHWVLAAIALGLILAGFVAKYGLL